MSCPQMLDSGTVIGNKQRSFSYKLEEALGAGSFGRVYRATDMQTGTVVALKHLKIVDEEQLKQTRKECDILQRLKHENIMRCHDMFTDDEREFHYIQTFELIIGRTLQDFIFEQLDANFMASDEHYSQAAIEFYENALKPLVKEQKMGAVPTTEDPVALRQRYFDSAPLYFKKLFKRIIRKDQLIGEFAAPNPPTRSSELYGAGDIILPKEQMSVKSSYLSVVESIFDQFLDALIYLDQQSVIHSDLKPENMMITFADNRLKIIDFGNFQKSGTTDPPSGTQGFQAPETTSFPVRKLFNITSFSPKIDVWSAGVILYIMLFGYLPQLITTNVPLSQIQQCYSCYLPPSVYVDKCDDKYINLFDKIFISNPVNRPSAKQLREIFQPIRLKVENTEEVKQIKFVFVGAQHVGKKTMVERFAGKKLTDQVSFVSTQVVVADERVQLQFYDTKGYEGNENNWPLLERFCSCKDVVVFCYDNQQSLDVLEKLYQVVDTDEVVVYVLGIHRGKKTCQYSGNLPNIRAVVSVHDASTFEKFVLEATQLCLKEGLYRWEQVAK